MRKNHPQYGFSLLELMIVLVLGAMLTGVVATSLSKGPVLRKNARDVVSSLRHARSLAIMQQQDAVWRMNIEQKKFWIQSIKQQRSRQLDESIETKVLTAESEVSSQSEAGIRFFPDGSSTGGKVELSYKEQHYQINVEWISGRVTLQ
ncbi:MAG: GspH/FimT family pseudopilin [bacterium]